MNKPNKHSIYDGHLPLDFGEFRIVIIHRRLIQGLHDESLQHAIQCNNEEDSNCKCNNFIKNTSV